MEGQLFQVWKRAKPSCHCDFFFSLSCSYHSSFYFTSLLPSNFLLLLSSLLLLLLFLSPLSTGAFPSPRILSHPTSSFSSLLTSIILTLNSSFLCLPLCSSFHPCPGTDTANFFSFFSHPCPSFLPSYSNCLSLII